MDEFQSKIADKSWYQRLWRPSMGWSYLVICLFDFLIAPIMNAIFQSQYYSAHDFVPWNPITLGSGGLYHISMMLIVGVTAYSRGQEKMKILETLTSVAFKVPPSPEPDIEPEVEPEVKK